MINTNQPKWISKLNIPLEEEESSIFWNTSPKEYSRLVEIIDSIIKDRDNEIIELAKEMMCEEGDSSVHYDTDTAFDYGWNRSLKKLSDRIQNHDL